MQYGEIRGHLQNDFGTLSQKTGLKTFETQNSDFLSEQAFYLQ